jgi:hypothetical protein
VVDNFFYNGLNQLQAKQQGITERGARQSRGEVGNFILQFNLQGLRLASLNNGLQREEQGNQCVQGSSFILQWLGSASITIDSRERGKVINVG